MMRVIAINSTAKSEICDSTTRDIAYSIQLVYNLTIMVRFVRKEDTLIKEY